jgi:hypothetical protein
MDRNKRREEESKKKTRLQSIEERIYSVHNGVEWKDRRSVIHENTGQENTNWEPIQEEQVTVVETQPTNNTFFRKLSRRLFYFALFFFLLVVGVSVYQFFFNTNTISSNKIGLAVEAPSYIDGGELFPLDVFISNENNAALENVDLIVEYPRGESMTSQQDTVVTRVGIGTIEPKNIKKGTVDIVLYGREGNNRDIAVYIEYYAPGSSVVLKKNITHTLTIKSAPLVILTESLKETAANQEITFTVRVKAERGKTLENLLVNIQYPNGFQYNGANIEPAFGNNVWRFDTIEKGETKDIVVRGSLRGEDGDEKVFRVSTGIPNIINSPEIAVVFADTKSAIVVKKPFIELTGVFENSAQMSTGDFAIKAGERTKAVVTYKNNIPETVSNLVLTAKLSGEIINKRRISVVNGYYDSAKNTIVWDRLTNPRLAQVLPGESGEVAFFVESFPLSAKQNGYFSNPEIKAEFSISGKRFNNSDVPEVNVVGRSLTGRVITESGLEARVLSEGGPLQYVGTRPLMVEKESSYTLVLTLKNRSNQLTNAAAQMVLPKYVRYIAPVSPDNENVVYNENSRTLTWNIGSVAADTGYGRANRSLYLLLSVTPSENQAGSQIPLTQEGIVFNAKDSHTETQIQRIYSGIETPDEVQ